jgi:hypothetical protein
LVLACAHLRSALRRADKQTHQRNCLYTQFLFNSLTRSWASYGP